MTARIKAIPGEMTDLERLARAVFPDAARAYDETLAYAEDEIGWPTDKAVEYVESSHRSNRPEYNIHHARATVRAVLNALLPPSEAMIEAALHAHVPASAVVPAGSEVWHWLPQKGDHPPHETWTPHETAREVLRCAFTAAIFSILQEPDR